MGDIHFSILTNWLGLRILNLTTQARFLRVRSGESAVGPATLKWKGERMGTRQALARFGLHNLEQREERILSSLSSGLNRLGGYILDVAVVLQVAAGGVILLGASAPGSPRSEPRSGDTISVLLQPRTALAADSPSRRRSYCN